MIDCIKRYLPVEKRPYIQGHEANPGGRALARIAASNPAVGIDVYPL